MFHTIVLKWLIWFQQHGENIVSLKCYFEFYLGGILFSMSLFIFFIHSTFLPEVPKEACYFSEFLPHASYTGFTDNPAKPWQRETDRRQSRGGAIFYIKDTTTHLTKFYITRCITHIIHASWKHPCHSRAWWVLPGTLKLYLQI